MKALTLLILTTAIVVSSVSTGSSSPYKLITPEFYTALSGDLQVNYTIPTHVALPHAFVRLEYWSKGKTEHLIITTLSLRLGFSAGSLVVGCGVIEFAGNYTLRMYTRVNGDILTEASLEVRWPEIGLSLPDTHKAQTSGVELRIISRANCAFKLHRHFLQAKVLFQRTELQSSVLTFPSAEEIFVSNYTSINVPFTTLTLACNLFDLDGFYQAVIVSSAQESPVASASNIMTVTWSSGYQLSFINKSAFPCRGSLFVMYSHPPCSGLDKFRLYSYTPTSQGSPASPLERAYVTEVVANPDNARTSFSCVLFNQSASGFCLIYVSITRNDIVTEQTQACLPAQADSAFPIDGAWSKWTSWTSCSVTCGTGKQSRFRMCNEPPPKHGGRFCVGDPVEWKPCDVHCPEAIPRTPLHSPHIDPDCACGCSLASEKGQIIATGRCPGLSTWLIKVKDGHVIALRFDYFRLNYTLQWVKIRDGTAATNVLLFSSSNTGYPLEIVSSGTAMRVELMTTYVTTPPAGIFPKNATLPIHAQGFIANFDVRALIISSTAPVLYKYEKETVLNSTITIVGIVVCAVVIIVAVVFVIIQRTFFRRRVKYTMTSSGDSPAHQTPTAGSSAEHRVSTAQSSSSPSSPGNAINVDMEVPLTGKSQRKSIGGRTSRASSTSSVNSQKTTHTKNKGETSSTGKGSNNSPKPSSKNYSSMTSPYGIEIIDTDEKNHAEVNGPSKLKAPRGPLAQGIIQKHSPITPVSPATKLGLLNKRRQEKKSKAVTADVERDITGSSGSMSPSTTKAEVNYPQSSVVRTTLQEVSKSLSERPKRGGHRPPSEEIPLLDSMTSSQESPLHFNNIVKSESIDSATTSFVHPPTAKARRPTSLTESYSNDTPDKPEPKVDSQKSEGAIKGNISKLTSQKPAVVTVTSSHLPSIIKTAPNVNNKPPSGSILSPPYKPKHPLNQTVSNIPINKDKNGIKQQKTALEERQTILPKPDGQSPKLQRHEISSIAAAAAEKDLASPGRVSKASSKGSKNNVSSPARSVATPSEIEGLELEYDDFIEDDPLSYFDYEETQKLAFRGVERLGKTPMEEEDENDGV